MNRREVESFWRSNNPVMWGVITTAVVGAVGAFVFLQPVCEPSFWGGQICNNGKWASFLDNSPNEVGDTLAGFAGTLAFVWIIVTVGLQSQELAEQREKLRLTRLEMKEQREATQDMARSMSAQARIFEAEARQRDEDRAEALFNENLRSFIVAINEASAKGLAWHFSNDVFYEDFITNGDVHSYYLGDQRSADKTIDDAISHLRRRLCNTHEHLWELLHTSVDYKLPARTNLVPDLIQKIETILAMEDTLSSPQRERLSRMRLHEIKSDLGKLVETRKLWAEAA
ncbi:hypothetical protein [Ruegeria meonggei]|uniref:hypothetical protein n=1 Tax=Ruegeria meonggei TaxID=1446476 RepID=UPI003671E9E4